MARWLRQGCNHWHDPPLDWRSAGLSPPQPLRTTTFCHKVSRSIVSRPFVETWFHTYPMAHRNPLFYPWSRRQAVEPLFHYELRLLNMPCLRRSNFQGQESFVLPALHKPTPHRNLLVCMYQVGFRIGIYRGISSWCPIWSYPCYLLCLTILLSILSGRFHHSLIRSLDHQES